MSKITQYLLLAGVVMATMPVNAQNVNNVQSRLDRIEREMNTLSRSVYKGDVPPPSIQMQGDPSQTAAMELRLNQIEDQMRRLTGMIEETNYKLRKLEQSGVSNVAQQPQPTMANNNYDDDSSLVVDETPYQLGTINNGASASPAALYDKAFGYLQVNDYASAQATFDEFLSAYPDHSLAANSKYWLGETYYARGDYKTASQKFALSFKDHPEGQKAPDTLLKLAMALNAQDMKTEACLTLGELKSRFPNAPSSVTTKADSERAAYGCDA